MAAGPSVEKKRKTSGGTRFKFSWTLPENITSPVLEQTEALLQIYLLLSQVGYQGGLSIAGGYMHAYSWSRDDRLAGQFRELD